MHSEIAQQLAKSAVRLAQLLNRLPIRTRIWNANEFSLESLVSSNINVSGCKTPYTAGAVGLAFVPLIAIPMQHQSVFQLQVMASPAQVIRYANFHSWPMLFLLRYRPTLPVGRSTSSPYIYKLWPFSCYWEFFRFL